MASEREVTHHESNITATVSDEFEHDNVLRPHTHKVRYGNGRWVFANRMEYDGEDRLITKWVGGMPMEDDRFLQEVNYAYDDIGRLIRINNPGTFLCNIGKEVCDFSLKLDFPLLWGENCDRLSGVKINGQVYPLATSWDLLAHQSQIAPAIEEALHAYGLEGEVSTSFVEFNGGQTLSINVTGTFATELSLILGTCGEEVALTPDCCIIPPVTPDPPISQPGEPRACTADLYHQLMRYNGLDIRHISIGSACVRMSNNYKYDGLHRITAMDNVLFGPDPHPDAFSTTYSYDAAGNIRQLMRRGLIGTGVGNTPQSDTIDLLDYTYAGSDSLSSILVNVKDRASNPLAQPLGVTASESGYGHDGNGNLTLADPVLQAQYNIMNLPTSIRTSAGKRHFAYVYGGGKYEARIEADTALSETRHYLGGIEFVDGNPESYNFGDGRIVYSDSVPPRPQFRLTDHLGNTVVFFEDKNLDGCITTEADTSGLAVEVLQRLWYYPFGLQMENLSTWETAPGQAYRYNGKERDTLSGWTDFGARWGILEIGRWNGVDPLAGEFPGWSPFSSMLNNPISFVDPDGKAPTSPIFDPNGNFLGVDSKGYTGEIIIMSAKAYNIVTGYGNNTLDHGSVAGLIEDGHAFKLNDAGLNAKGFSKVYTHVTKQLKGVNFSRLEGGIVNIIDTPIDEDGNMGHANGDSFGKWTNLPINAEAGTIINSDNTINVTTRLLGGTGQFTTVEYTQSVLGIHEYKGHGLNKIPEAFPAHERAYKLQFNHKGTFDKLTPFQQKSIKIKAGIK